jgi:hypothetical protein
MNFKPMYKKRNQKRNGFITQFCQFANLPFCHIYKVTCLIFGVRKCMISQAVR